MSQRWNELLFADWPVGVDQVTRALPDGVEVDTYDGRAWLGVVPFTMDRVRTRITAERSIAIPGASAFPELNLRTYVRSRRTGRRGVYFFSLDAGSLLAVIGARTLFHLPYFLASMRHGKDADGRMRYESRRLLTSGDVEFRARYSGDGQPRRSEAGSLAHFLTERYCLYTQHGRETMVGDIHHLPWSLETGEAEIERNGLPAAHGLKLPPTAPVLHFSRVLEVFVWSLRRDE